VIDRSLVSRRVCPLVFLAWVLQSPFAAGAEGQRYPSNEDLRHVRALVEPRLAPDGRSVLVRVVDGAAEGGKGHLYLLSLTGGARALTSSPASDPRGEHDGTFTADGRSILFIAHRGEHDGLFRLSLDGGEAMAVPITVPVRVDQSTDPDAITALLPATTERPEARLAGDVVGIRVAQNGAMAVLVRDPETPGEKALLEGKADAVAVDHDRHRVRVYRLDGSREAPQSRDLGAGLPDGDVVDAAWSPDGERLLVLLEAPAHASDLSPSMSAWLLPATGSATPERLSQVPPTVSSIGWSLDGTQVNFVAQSQADTPPGYSSVYTLDLAHHRVQTWSEGEASVLGRPRADRDGGILVGAQSGLEQRILLYTPQASAPLEAGLPAASVEAFDANEAGIAMVGSSSGVPSAVYVAQRFGDAWVRLESPPVAPEHTRTQAARRIKWVHEGRTLEGLLYLPDTDGAARVPLVLEVHGGPLGAYSDRYDPFVDFLLGQGWAVLRTNPRGSTGRGPAFAAANRNDLGGGDFRDIMSGLDWALTHASIDPERLAFIGYSYGGEMAGFVEGRTTRFKAIVSGAPVIDQFSEYGTEDGSWYDRWYFGKPWEHVKDAWRQSPLSGAATARTPFLLLQGLADITDPPGQSQEMYRALRQHGVPVELVMYPREDHGGLARGLYGEPSPEPWHGFDARRRVVDFIRRAFEAPTR